jgi:hypothetical protein
MGLSIEDLIGSAKPPVRSVTICMDQSMQAEHDELVERLDQVRRDNPAKMGDTAEGHDLAVRIGEVEEAMQKHLQTFRLKGLSKGALNVLYKRFPSKDKQQVWDAEAGGHALVAAAALDPEMTEEQAERLIDALSQGQASLLVGTAWLASTGSSAVPLSARASELRRASA